MDQLLMSTAWERKENESVDIFLLRKELQTKTLHDITRKRGNCYMIKFGENDIRPMWEDQIDFPELLKMITPSLSITPFDCPLCQPYDYFDIHTNQYVERRYLTKIINPKYPEGFIDKAGIWAKCACLKKGDAVKWLKFRRKGV